jgi:AcrR family transcriptional regulator
MPLRPRTVPRKRPQQARSRATIDVILTATARVLVKEGFDRASTNRIAEAAGVSVGSLYQYFPGKEALVAALVERHVDEMTAIIDEAMERIGLLPLREAIQLMVSLMLRAHSVDPKLHKVLIEQVPRIGRLERVHDIEARVTRLARSYMEQHAAEIRPQNLDLAALVVVQTIEALTHAAVVQQPDRVVDEQLTLEIGEMVLRYLQK